MQILIRLAGVQLGPYSEEQVRQHITEGLLSLTDSAQSPGMDEWVTLAEVLAKAPPPTVALPGPAKQADPDPESEAEFKSFVEEPRRAPEAPPGVRHLPTRPQEQPPSQDSMDGAFSKKTVLLGPQTPVIPPTGKVSSSSASMTSPMVPVTPSTRKTSRPALNSSGNASTSPLPTRIIDPAKKLPPDSPLSKPKFPAAEDLPPTKPAAAPTVESLTAKTVPMRSKAPPAPPKPASTEPMPSRVSPKPTKPPTSTTPAVEEITQKLERMVQPDAKPNAATAAKLEEISQRIGLPKKKIGKIEPKEDVVSLPDDPETKSTDKRAPGRILPRLIFACGVIAALALYYIWSPYHAAASLRTALAGGDPSDLNATIDFQSVKESLKDQVKTQLAQVGNTDASVLTALNNSIDLYVTSGGLSELITKADKFSDEDRDQRISPSVAAKILSAFNNEPAAGQGLAGLTDFVINRNEAMLHLRFGLLGWKLNRIDLRPDWLSAAPAGLTSPLLSPVVDTYLEHGDTKAKASDWPGAIASYSQVLSVDPHSSVALHARGNAERSKGDFDGAIKDYTQALTINPQMAPAYEDRGNAKAAKNDQDGAIADYTQAIHIDPTIATAYDSRGNAKTAKGDDLEGAISDFTQAITLDPNRASTYSDRGFARQANGNLDGAIADYTQALALSPKTAIAYYNRGLAKQAQGNLGAAVLDFDHALAFDPKSPWASSAYFYRGNAKSSTGHGDDAIDDYTQAITLNPKLAMAYCNRGLALQGKGDLDKAVADFTQALSIDPKIAPAYTNRGLIRAQKNDPDGAIADTSQALDLDPRNGQALYTRGFAKLTKGNLDGAATDLKQYTDLGVRDHTSDHARLYQWVIGKAQNAADPDQALSDAMENSWNSPPADQGSKTGGYLLGRVTEPDYLAAATAADAKVDQAQHCVANYFVGMKRLFAGDKKGAADAFRASVATGQKDAPEYVLAQAQLQSLEPQVPPPATTAPATIRLPPAP